MSSTSTIGGYLVERLEQTGLRHVFGIQIGRASCRERV